jgi:hypothetical protein
MKRRWSALPVLVLIAAAAVQLEARPAGADQTFKIYVEHAGVYGLSFEALAAAGLEGPLPSAGIGLRNLGEPVPVWVDDGGDGSFGPGDELHFLGDVLRGQESYLDPYSRFNCYVLAFADADPWHGETRVASAEAPSRPADLAAHHHLEADRVMVRFRERHDEPEEVWYWERLSVVDREPFRLELAFEGLLRAAAPGDDSVTPADALSELIRQAGSAGPSGPDRGLPEAIASAFTAGTPPSTTVRLRFGLRGWSEPRHLEAQRQPHHEVEFRLNGTAVGRARWDGTGHHVVELEILSDVVNDGPNTLELVVPKRSYPDSGDLVVDVVLLNWIELDYRHEPVIGREQLRLRPLAVEGPFELEITSSEGEAVALYLPTGVRYRGDDSGLATALEGGDDDLRLVPGRAVAAPAEFVLDRESRLASREHRADYIMITHNSLASSLERLADFHRARGLTVAVVDVQDIYDDFNFGIVHPRAIKDFLDHARRDWQPPAPRFVLLVGDASWDFKNTTADDLNYADWTFRPGEAKFFVKNSSTPYAEGAELNHRNLVPTWGYPTLEGHAASDTWFVCFDDGDTLPDMAIGRLPVVSQAELEGVIDKTVAFAAEPPVGPWRRELLFIANESSSFQFRSDQLAELFGGRGFVSTRIYPHPSEPANEHHTRQIIEILDRGVQAVHFIGHGGRYIWRTGPPDLAKNHDLFTLEHLDQLAPNRRLPVVLSLTCYSAPFDHPSADSIGEKLLRIPGRGAIAVFAASWRNSPSPLMGEALFRELTNPGATIGEAIMRAKREFRSDVLVQTYNLLGDPAVPVAAPGHVLELELGRVGGELELRVASPVAVADGELLVDWVAEEGRTLRSDRVPVRGDRARLVVEAAALGDGAVPVGVRAYLWDEGAGVDGIGWLSIEEGGAHGEERNDEEE